MTENEKRISLLSEAEIEGLYARPAFDQEERRHYFILNNEENTVMQNYAHGKTRLYFLLQLSYFKAKQQFFSFRLDDVINDATFINNTYFSGKIVLSGKISREYIKRQKEDILTLCNYCIFSKNNEIKIIADLCELIRLYPKPHNALRQLIIYFEHHSIVLPTYRRLQDVFSQAYRIEQTRLNKLFSSIPEDIKTELNDLVKNKDGLTELNVMRADQKNFQYTAVSLEVKKSKKISGLYEYTKSFIPTLALSNNAAMYYADLTEQYAASRLRRLNKPQQRLHLICFIYRRYQQFMDNLITSFMYHVRATVAEGKTYAETAQIEHSSQVIADFPKLAKFLIWFPNQKNRPTITYYQLSKEAYQILPETQFMPLSELIAGKTFDKKAARWIFYGKLSRKFALYLRPALTTIQFEYYLKNNTLMDFMHALKTHYTSGKSPSKFRLSDQLASKIPKNMLPYLKAHPDDKYIDPHRFEFFVYQKMYHHLDRGRLFCNDSISYKDLDNDLVPDKMVDNVAQISEKFGYARIPIYCQKYLDDKLNELDAAWERTTQSIESGNNAGFKLKVENNKPKWSLLYDTSPTLDDKFLTGLPKIEIANLIKFVGDTVGMWDTFTHIKGRYIKRKQAETLALNACILAEAFGISIEKMAEMSDMSYHALRSTHEDFFNVATLSATNNIVADFIASLPIFKVWNLMDDKLLADADGQKIPSTNSTIQSRYSKKFLGKGKGISIYTLIANFVAVNATNIGPNEYEGHSLYDMIYGNSTEITIDMVTGDNHSLNKFNFVLLGSINVDYVPSIKNIREAADALYSVKHPNNYKGILKPKGQIKQHRIKSEERGILRVLLSLLMQDNTQTIIVRKLNSHARYARLSAALLEYNKILKSTHVLNLIHDMHLRKVLKTARNRTESYHSLQILIRKIYHGIFKGKKIKDNRVSAHATRLVANCIVAYNSIILNSIYVKLVEQGVSKKILEEFARISPIAWSHLIFTGRYNFLKHLGKIDIEQFVAILEKQWQERVNKKKSTIV